MAIIKDPNHGVVSVSEKDRYNLRIRFHGRSCLLGEKVDVGIHQTDSSNVTERTLSILFKESTEPVREVLIPKKLAKQAKIKEGDKIEYDVQKRLRGVPSGHFLVFCADVSKNEQESTQKLNLERTLPDWIKESF